MDTESQVRADSVNGLETINSFILLMFNWLVLMMD